MKVKVKIINEKSEFFNQCFQAKKTDGGYKVKTPIGKVFYGYSEVEEKSERKIFNETAQEEE